jgi:hypothetical protein
MFDLVSKKIVIQTFKDEPRWCLHGTPPDGPVFMLRGGVEVIGFLDCEGDAPPGKPFFNWIVDNEEIRTEVDPLRDEFRLPSEDEAKRTRHRVRTNIS